MESLPLSAVPMGVCAFLVYAYLLFCGWRAGMLHQYFWFYLVVMTYLGTHLLNWSTIWIIGYHSQAFLHMYHATSIVEMAVELMLLAHIYQMAADRWGAVRIITVLGKTAMFGLVLWHYSHILEFRLGLLLLYLETILAFMILAQLCVGEGAKMGRVWGGIFLGLFIKVVVEFQASISLLFDQWTYQQWTASIQPIKFLPWAVFVAVMSNVRGRAAEVEEGLPDHPSWSPPVLFFLGWGLAVLEIARRSARRRSREQ